VLHYTVDPITQQVSELSLVSAPSGKQQSSLVESSTDGVVEPGDDSVSSEEDNDVAIVEVEPAGTKDETGKNEEYVCRTYLVLSTARVLYCLPVLGVSPSPSTHDLYKCKNLDL